MNVPKGMTPPYTPAMEKLQRLLRFHRQHVFDPIVGDAHGRAIDRLKRSKTCLAMFALHEDRARKALNESLTRQGY